MQQISVINAAKMINTEPTQVVDIRDLTSFGSGHIEGATRVDNTNIQYFIDNADLDKNLLVCCYHGNSSISAASYFESQGFVKVFSLDGGMSSWSLSQPTETGE